MLWYPILSRVYLMQNTPSQGIGSRITVPVLTILLSAALLFAVIASPESAAAQSPATDRAALVALYNATDGDNWADNTNWLSDRPLNEWHGVTTNEESRVVHLVLIENNLSGTIPPELSNLSNLQRLWLWSNQLTGPIPPEIGNLSDLWSLNLNRNELTGTIPPEIGNMSNLRTLSLWGNQLTGAIPPEIGNMSNLKYLYLTDNHLTGVVPPEIGNLSNLRELALDNNELTGAIPPEIGSLYNLETLGLSSNELTGPLPQSLTRLTNLRYLRYLSFNNGASGLCAPADSAFQAWLDALEYVDDGPNCDDTQPPQPPPGDQCVEPLPDDGAVNGSWADNCLSTNKSGSYARYYTFNLNQTSNVTITLDSDADTYLYLLNGSGRDGTVALENDDHGILTNTEACADASGLSPTDSCIIASLAAGDYTIEATTYYSNTEGAFELTVTIGGTVAPPPPPSNLEAAACNEDDLASASLSDFVLDDTDSSRPDDPGYWGVIGWHTASWTDGVVAAIACGAIQYNSIENARWDSLNYSTAMQHIGTFVEVSRHEQVFPSYIGDDMLAFRYQYEVEDETSTLDVTAVQIRFLNADSITISWVTYYLLDTDAYAPLGDVQAIVSGVAARIFGTGSAHSQSQSAQNSNRVHELFGFIE